MVDWLTHYMVIPLVNVWHFRLCRIMFLMLGKIGHTKDYDEHQWIFLLQIWFKKGIDVVENGPWMIRTIPIILKKWTTSTILKKEELTSVSVRVKLHVVPMAAFTADGLCAIATKIGKPLCLIPLQVRCATVVERN